MHVYICVVMSCCGCGYMYICTCVYQYRGFDISAYVCKHTLSMYAVCANVRVYMYIYITIDI